MSNQNSDSISVIDASIAAIKAKKAAKSGGTAEPSAKSDGAKPTVTKLPPKLSDAEKEAIRAAKLAERQAAQAERKAAREAKRAAKLAEREANRKPAHMSKVERAASKLPALGEDAQELYTDITTNLGRDQVAALSAHLAHFNRAMATQSSLTVKIAEGDEVRVITGDPKFIGMTGTVVKSARIRAYVQFPGIEKLHYTFTSDLERVEAEVGEIEEPAAATG